MNTTALLLAVAIASTPQSVSAPVKTERGWLSSLGVGLLVLTGAGVGVGVAGVMGANEASMRLRPYGGTPAPDEVPSTDALGERFRSNLFLAVSSFSVGALALAGGIICLLVDRPMVKVAFAPGPHGGVLVLSGRF